MSKVKQWYMDNNFYDVSEMALRDEDAEEKSAEFKQAHIDECDSIICEYDFCNDFRQEQISKYRDK